MNFDGQTGDVVNRTCEGPLAITAECASSAKIVCF